MLPIDSNASKHQLMIQNLRVSAILRESAKTDELLTGYFNESLQLLASYFPAGSLGFGRIHDGTFYLLHRFDIHTGEHLFSSFFYIIVLGLLPLPFFSPVQGGANLPCDSSFRWASTCLLQLGRPTVSACRELFIGCLCIVTIWQVLFPL